ncbi:MAG: ComEC/Rec2 family competence protein, partial [Mycobacterium sp.]
MDEGATTLDLRLVPAAITAWSVTAAGILWQVTGLTVTLAVAVATTVAVGWWFRARGDDADKRAIGGGVLAVAVVGAAFAISVGLRVDALRQQPITDRYGTIATVVVTPVESPRHLGGNRAMFRGALEVLDGHEAAGRVVVFASAAAFSELSAGRPVGFRAQVGRPTRQDLTVAVLSATGQPTWGEAATVYRVADEIRGGFADAARVALPADQAAMLPALVLGDTSALPQQTTAEFRTSGLTHLTAVSGANVTIVCGAVLLSAGLVGPRVAVVLAAFALLVFVIVVQPSA